MVNSIYGQIYNLLETAIFGGEASSAVYGVLICEGVSAIACCLLLALPFIIVWRVIRRFL